MCYCDDCQAFAHYLGRADEILDARGGSDIYQMSPARLAFTQGAEHLACVNLTGKITLRWYADCCKTPICNTAKTPKLPFIGLIHSYVGQTADGQSLADVAGPIRGCVQGKFATPSDESLPHEPASVPLAMLRFARLALTWRLQGAAKSTPLFDVQSGRPIVEPRILSEAENQQLRASMS